MTAQAVRGGHSMFILERITLERVQKWSLIAIAAFTAFYAITSLALPFGWDHGTIAAVGGSFVHGKLPYVDSWDVKGPAAYVPYALMQALFGPTMWGARLLDIFVAGLASYVFYQCMTRLTQKAAGVWAAFALYFWVASAGWFFTATPDSWTVALGVFAIAPLLRADKAPDARLLAASGFIIGCAGLIKPFFLLMGLAPLLSIVAAPALTYSRRAILAAALAAGAAAPILFTIAYYAALGGLPQAIEVLILYNLATYGGLKAGVPLLDGWAAFLSRPTIAILAPFVVLGVWSFRKNRPVIWPALGWLIATILSVVAQGKYYYYHWMPVYAPLLLLGVLGAFSLGGGSRRGSAPWIVALGAALMFSAQITAIPARDAVKAAYYFVLKRSPQNYYNSFSFVVDGKALFNAGDEVAAANYLAAHTAPDEGVFIWGNHATARYLADRPNPTRFTIEFPLSLPGKYLAPYRAEAMRDLRSRPPVYIVVGTNWWRPDTKEQALAKFAALSDFLHSNYRLETSFGNLDLYRRVTDPAATSAPARQE